MAIPAVLLAAACLAYAAGEAVDPEPALPPGVSTSSETGAPALSIEVAPDVYAPSFVVPASTDAAVELEGVERDAAPESQGASPPAAVMAPPDAPRPARQSRASRRSLPVFDDAAAVKPVALPAGYQPIRGVHLSAWVAGEPQGRRPFLDAVASTVVNAVVVPLKETDGRVYIPGVSKARAWGTAFHAIPDPGGLLADIHARGLKAVARIVVFKDNLLARKREDLGVKRPDGSLWLNIKGVTWVDPYQREVWEYNVDLAVEAARLGFDEIQFDYIRFPSDGRTELCRYSRKDHSPQAAVASVQEFLRYARGRLKPLRLPVSVAVFGMTTTAHTDMGIGQDMRALASLSDFVSPMMYPSHYARGEYGLKDPNQEPYKVVFRGLGDAKRRLGSDSWKLRPYLQDFSLGHRYTAFEVQAQLLAAQRQGVESWILWNPSNRYTWKAIQKRNDSPLRYGSQSD